MGLAPKTVPSGRHGNYLQDLSDICTSLDAYSSIILERETNESHTPLSSQPKSEFSPDFYQSDSSLVEPSSINDYPVKAIKLAPNKNRLEKRQKTYYLKGIKYSFGAQRFIVNSENSINLFIRNHL